MASAASLGQGGRWSFINVRPIKGASRVSPTIIAEVATDLRQIQGRYYRTGGAMRWTGRLEAATASPVPSASKQNCSSQWRQTAFALQRDAWIEEWGLHRVRQTGTALVDADSGRPWLHNPSGSSYR